MQRHDDAAYGRLLLAAGRFADSCAWDETGEERYSSLRTGASMLGDFGEVQVGHEIFTPDAHYALTRAIAMLQAIKNDPNLPRPVDDEIKRLKAELARFKRR